MKIRIEEIVWDADIYPRVVWDLNTVNKYADAIGDGAVFPLLVLEEGSLRLLDGKHRLEAYKKLGVEEVEVELHEVPAGLTPLLYAASLSAKHGHVLSNMEKRHVARVQKEGGKASDEEIAGLLGVSRATVWNWTKDIGRQQREAVEAVVLELRQEGLSLSEVAEISELPRSTVQSIVSRGLVVSEGAYEGSKNEQFVQDVRCSLHLGDNLAWLKSLPSGSVSLIYMDPPFNSGTDYGDFGDSWEWDGGSVEAMKRLLESDLSGWVVAVENTVKDSGTRSYLYFMAERLLECGRVLSDTGSIWVHCDDAANYHIRLLLDQLFGADGYKNEVCWLRTTGTKATINKFSRSLDRVIWYARPGFCWNKPLGVLNEEKVVRDFIHNDGDGRGPYQLSPLFYTMPSMSFINRTSSSTQPWRGYDPGANKKQWVVPKILQQKLGLDPSLTSQQKLDALDAAGYIHFGSKDGSLPHYKRYLSDVEGVPLKDLWDDIPAILSGKESVGYQTQKPLTLLDRIISSTSNPGDTVLDPFVGSGTTVLAALALGRNGLGCDLNPQSIEVTHKRLIDAGFEGVVDIGQQRAA